MQGYTIKFLHIVQSLAKRYPDRPVFKLAEKAISSGVSIVDIADHMNVSRQSVYKWFRGETAMRDQDVEKLEQYLKNF